ncbi:MULTISPECIES: hypothetical protein [Corallococcus]|nr:MULTISPECIES: hypothetical protein [Corallococcus]
MSSLRTAQKFDLAPYLERWGEPEPEVAVEAAPEKPRRPRSKAAR